MNKNYTLLEKRELPETNAVGYMYAHESGARILYVKSEDNNKVFNVIFRTPPPDSTGLPHILEHSVLNGSEKYPVKDPFGTLMRGSLVTFLNAMTWSDKTMYPVASCNDKDFMNLMGVYLDAVYKPLIHKKDDAFLQEGWHYDLESPEGELKINGVVYNEMKGATSDPDDVLGEKLNELMFPESHYRFSSGGDPDVIPSLTYETFKEFHSTLYHPSNSFIYLYGDMDINACFDKLDEYLGAVPNISETLMARLDLPKQQLHEAPVFAEDYYPIAEGDDPDGKNNVGAVFALGGYPGPLTLVSLDILNYILMETPASPLKNTLLEKNAGESVKGYFDSHMEQSIYALSAKNSRLDGAAFRDMLMETLGDITAKGLDKKYVEACLNAMEFKYREKDSWAPKGLMFCINYAAGWVYGKNPFDYFNPIECIASIREKLAAGESYFENIINDLFIKNNFAGYVTLKAAPGLQAKKDAALRDKLQAHKSSLSTEETTRIIERKKALTERQNTPDTPEAMATIPMVGLEDIKKEAEIIRMDDTSDGARLLRAHIDTDGIVYNNLLFNMDCLTKAELPVAGILSRLLGKLNTKRRSFADLSNEINLHLGGVDFGFSINGHKDGLSFTPVMEMNIRALETKTSELYAIAGEILTETLFDDKARVKMLLTERRAELESAFINAGNSYGIYRAMSYLNDKYAYRDLTSGYGLYEYVKALTEDFDNRFEAFREMLISVSRKLFGKRGLIVALACSEGTASQAAALANELYGILPQGAGSVLDKLVPGVRNEAFAVESKVCYNIMAADFMAKNFPYSGGMHVLSNVVSEGYLLQEIRVKGGAYGYGSDFGVDGGMFFFTYRDPNLSRSYDVFKALPDFIANFKPSDREMLQYALGAVNRLDRPMTPRRKLAHAVKMHLSGMTPELLQTERDQLLAADAAVIRGYAPMLSACVGDGSICTFGGEAKINESANLFDRIVKL